MSLTDKPSQVVVMRAEDVPMPGTSGQSPHHRYRYPQLSIESRFLGDLAGDCLRVEMLYAGICGTDLHLVQSNSESGYVLTSAPAIIPPTGRVIGHEGVGRVIAKGKNAQGPDVGSIVAFASIVACMRCEVCLRGAFNQCPTSSLLGMEVDGLFGTVVDLPASLAYDVSSLVKTDQDLRAVACLEPAGVALLACENARISPGESVVVFGGGPIGVYCAMLSKRVFGAAYVALVEPEASRREVASAWCDDVYDVEDFFSQDATQFDVVIEGSGYLENVNRIFARIAPNGRVILLGRSGAPLTIDSVDHMITKAITVSGSRGHLGVLHKVMALYGTGQFPLGAVVTRELDSLSELLDNLREPDRIMQNDCKVLAKIN